MLRETLVRGGQQRSPGCDLDVEHLPSSAAAAGLQAAVSLKWPDGGSCSLCGIQTQLWPLSLRMYMTLNIYRPLHVSF